MTNNLQTQDIEFMNEALAEAKQALVEDEIPVGAVLVRDGVIVARNHNRTRQQSNPLAHAEKLIVESILSTGEKYLNDYTLYVTLEPCLMCSGILIWSRLERLVYSAEDPKSGCVGSIYNSLSDSHFNHHPVVRKGVLAEECGALLKDFFRSKRKIET
ncbi:MAG: nucleoside deaminase [Candidatus Cloacimonadaceae bacterium]